MQGLNHVSNRGPNPLNLLMGDANGWSINWDISLYKKNIDMKDWSRYQSLIQDKYTLTHLGLVSHICVMKNSPHFPSDAYMHRKSLYFSYRSRGRPTKQVSGQDGLVQDCSIFIANAMEILQSCTKPSACTRSAHSDTYHSLQHLSEVAADGLAMPDLSCHDLRPPHQYLQHNIW